MPNNAFGQAISHDLQNWQEPSFPEHQNVIGAYCTLEPLSVEKHAKDLFYAMSKSNGSMWTYMPYGPFETLKEYEQLLSEQAKSQDPQFYAIVLNESQKAVGVASYLRIAPSTGSIELGHISLSPELQKTSAATEAMYLFMKGAFDLGYRRFEWKCDELNQASCRAAERLGLSYEGIFRQATHYKNRNRDTAWFAAIDSEWPALKQAFERWLSPKNFDKAGKQKESLSDLTKAILKKSRA